MIQTDEELLNAIFGADDFERDVFFKCDWQFADKSAALKALRPFDLGKAPNGGFERSRLSLLACALAYADCEQWIAYSRQKSRYTGMKRYFGKAYNCRNIITEMEKLEGKGLLDHALVPPGSHRLPNPMQSSFRATQKLVDAMEHLERIPDPHEIIRLRQLYDRETGEVCYNKRPGGKYVSRLEGYEDTEQTKRYRSELEPINRFLKNIKLHWPRMEGSRVGLYNRFDKDGLLVTPLQIYRVFSRGSFETYGRFHGFWLGVDKEERPSILLNGEQTCEPDFSQMHLNMAYLEAGESPSEFGYHIQDYDLNMVKRAVSIELNASSRKSARKALMDEFDLEEDYADGVQEAVYEKHHIIRHQFHSDLGVTLMYKESCILQRAMQALVEENIPFLPIHDGLRVGISNQKRTVEIMQEAFKGLYPGFTPPVKVK